MNSILDSVIANAKDLARRHDYEGAMLLANELIGQHPNEMDVWLLRSYLHELEEDYVEATTDLSRAIELNSMEPHLYYNRGRYQFQLEDYTSAVQDFSKALELCDMYNNDYYREELYFWRAEVLLRLDKQNDALADLSKVRDDFASWTYKLRTKHDLLRDCSN